MTRDNEKIIKICADLSAFVRQSAVDLLLAGAPIDMVLQQLNLLEMAESAPQRLAENRDYRDGLNCGAMVARHL